MYNDYLKIVNCIKSSTTKEHFKACEKLCECFKVKWSKVETYLLYYEKLKLLHKNQSYGG